MNKALNIGKLSASGSFHLFIGKAISSIILAVGSLVLAGMLSAADYGIYAIALIPSQTLVLFVDWGLKSATTKFLACSNSKNKDEELTDIISTGLIFQIGISTIMSLSSFIFANFIATVFLKRPDATELIAIASFVVLGQALLNASQAIFNGLERMKYSSFIMICNAVLKSFFAPLLILFGFGALGAVVGYTVSFIISGIISVAIVYFFIFRSLNARKNHRTNRFNVLKPMLSYGLPLTASSILNEFLTQFYAFFMVIYSTDIMIGNYQIAANFTLILSFFTFPIATVLFPAFSKLDPKNELPLLRTIFSTAVKYSSLLLVPVTMATFVLSDSMVGTLYGQKWLSAPLFLTLSVLINLLVLFGNFVFSSFLAGVGKSNVLLKANIAQFLSGVVLAFVLIPQYGIVGMIFGLFLSRIPALVLGHYWLWNNYKVKVDFQMSAKIFTSALIALIITYFILGLLTTSYLIQLCLGGITYLATYVVLVAVFGAIDKNDLYNLKIMFSGLGVFSKPLNVFLALIEKLIVTFNPKKL